MTNGRIAIPSDGDGGLDGKRSGHFGHCSVFTIVDVENAKPQFHKGILEIRLPKKPDRRRINLV